MSETSEPSEIYCCECQEYIGDDDNVRMCRKCEEWICEGCFPKTCGYCLKILKKGDCRDHTKCKCNCRGSNSDDHDVLKCKCRCPCKCRTMNTRGCECNKSFMCSSCERNDEVTDKERFLMLRHLLEFEVGMSEKDFRDQLRKSGYLKKRK